MKFNIPDAIKHDLIIYVIRGIRKYEGDLQRIETWKTKGMRSNRWNPWRRERQAEYGEKINLLKQLLNDLEQ